MEWLDEWTRAAQRSSVVTQVFMRPGRLRSRLLEQRSRVNASDCAADITSHCSPSTGAAWMQLWGDSLGAWGLWFRSRRLRLETYQPTSRLGLGHLRLVPKTSSAKLCGPQYAVCTGFLDVVSLCCSYYCSSY